MHQIAFESTVSIAGRYHDGTYAVVQLGKTFQAARKQTHLY